MKRTVMVALLAMSSGVLAQGGKTSGEPIVVQPPALGTQVTGQHETPLGLYIIPWRNSDAAGGPAKPVRLLDQALLPHDEEVFRRLVEYNRALSEHLEQTGRVTP